MKYLIILGIVSLLFSVGVFLLEDKVISNLPDDNKFKRWWRNVLIGDAKDMDI